MLKKELQAIANRELVWPYVYKLWLSDAHRLQSEPAGQGQEKNSFRIYH